jgi:catechol 2,3-dioxygenase-like lactoylglutathione lyase family enzyme
VTLGCDYLDVAAASLARYGYRPEFIDRHVVNNPSKNSILASHCEAHGIGLLRSEAGFPIELVSYQSPMPSGFGRYVGVFETAPALEHVENIDFNAFFSGMPSCVVSTWAKGIIGDLGAPAFFVRGAQANAGLRQLVLPVTDLDRSRRFWHDVLGFGMVSETDELAELRFTSPIAAWCLELVLVTSPPPKVRPGLDARGMACLSLLSSNIGDDVRRVVSGGAKLTTEIFLIQINGRNMKVAILADPDGAFIELLQIVR